MTKSRKEGMEERREGERKTLDIVGTGQST